MVQERRLNRLPRSLTTGALAAGVVALYLFVLLRGSWSSPWPLP
ncbi:hypothetical protein [Allostreptomyces psammosilenae]|uniref:Uncharacterized protein n=1 Tax=Allostreptomyces psammosilenae TaxID=1892865 RepID=A0A852ZVD5_9ACTN|nr:hypothetical protein [Allostreptomyces psammosilenae]NYI04744.1 hypothetical protein [Allostreptomyces psammosilenae]